MQCETQQKRHLELGIGRCKMQQQTTLHQNSAEGGAIQEISDMYSQTVISRYVVDMPVCKVGSLMSPEPVRGEN